MDAHGSRDFLGALAFFQGIEECKPPGAASRRHLCDNAEDSRRCPPGVPDRVSTAAATHTPRVDEGSRPAARSLELQLPALEALKRRRAYDCVELRIFTGCPLIVLRNEGVLCRQDVARSERFGIVEPDQFSLDARPVKLAFVPIGRNIGFCDIHSTSPRDRPQVQGPGCRASEGPGQHLSCAAALPGPRCV